MKKAFHYYFDLFPEIMVRDDGICDHKHRKETEMYVKALSLFTISNMMVYVTISIGKRMKCK